MLFNTLTFLGFFAVVYTLYRLTMKQLRLQNLLLLIASFVFYGTWNWKFLFLLGGSIVIDFTVARLMDAPGSDRRRKVLMLSGIGIELAILGFFKYYNFGIESMANLLQMLGFQPHLPTLQIILPVGLSFYTFQSISYTVDVYRREIKACRDFLNFSVYLSYFPQLVAGPIEKATALLPQMEKQRTITSEDIHKGILWILMGYFKKVVIADSMAPMVSQAFGNPLPLSGWTSIIAIVAFAVQIYGDFSGYTLIARGISQLMGIKLMRNFNAPYLARSPRDFWARWHISLSSWLRMYLYFSLGGSRKGNGRTYFNLLATMTLGGLWHGANWNFVLWGIYHGLLLVVCHFFRIGDRKEKHNHPFVAAYQIILTFIFTLGGWLLFRVTSMQNLREIVWNITHNLKWSPEIPSFLIPTLLNLALLTVYHLWQELRNDDLILLKVRPFYRYLVYTFIVICLVASGFKDMPFIYFQF